MKTSASILLALFIALGYTDKPANRSAPHAASALRSFPIVRTDTGTWADTVRRGDTTFYSQGRIITHVSVLIDSLLVSSITTGSGVPNGPFHLSVDSLCAQERLGYNAALLVASSSGRNLPAQLAKVASCNGRVIVAVSRSKLKDANGLSVAAGVAEIGRWPWAEIGRYVHDSTIIGFYAGDDVSADEWGNGVPMPTRMARWDSIYAEFRWRAPGAATIIRAKPTELASWGYRGTNITTAWAQYRGPYRDKHPKTWVAGQVAAARAQQLGLVIGQNLLDGGCGPAVLADGRMNTACLPNLPGTGILGTTKDAANVRRYQTSPGEYLYYKAVFLTEPYACASIDWQWSPAWSASPSVGRTAEQIAQARAFHTQAGVKSAAMALGELARMRTPASCIHPARRSGQPR